MTGSPLHSTSGSPRQRPQRSPSPPKQGASPRSSAKNSAKNSPKNSPKQGNSGIPAVAAALLENLDDYDSEEDEVGN